DRAIGPFGLPLGRVRFGLVAGTSDAPGGNLAIQVELPALCRRQATGYGLLGTLLHVSSFGKDRPKPRRPVVRRRCQPYAILRDGDAAYPARMPVEKSS